MNTPDPSAVLRDLAVMALADQNNKTENAEAIALAERRKFLTEFATAAYDKAATFIAVLTAAGYAGFFAIWGWVASYLARWETLTIGFLLGFSMLAFILWQLHGMITIAQQQMSFAQAVMADDADFDAEQKKLAEKGLKLQARLVRMLPVMLSLTAIPGIAGGALLVIVSVRHLITGK